jgi:hypothetical protein
MLLLIEVYAEEFASELDPPEEFAIKRPQSEASGPETTLREVVKAVVASMKQRLLSSPSRCPSVSPRLHRKERHWCSLSAGTDLRLAP